MNVFLSLLGTILMALSVLGGCNPTAAAASAEQSRPSFQISFEYVEDAVPNTDLIDDPGVEVFVTLLAGNASGGTVRITTMKGSVSVVPNGSALYEYKNGESSFEVKRVVWNGFRCVQRSDNPGIWDC